MKRVRVDFNARDARDFVPLALERLGDDSLVGDAVEIYDGEEGFFGPATVADIDVERGIAYLDVSWSELRDPDPMPRVEARGDFVISTHSGVFFIEVKVKSGKSSADRAWMITEHPGHNTSIAGYERDEHLVAS
jgi:hypothetical protein